jgi:hypothetical protein
MARIIGGLAYVANYYFTLENDHSRSKRKLGGAAAVAEVAREEEGLTTNFVAPAVSSARPREGEGPGWIPAFAGMSGDCDFGRVMSA